MAHVLFALNLLAALGVLLCPLLAPTRGRAISDWTANLLGGGAIRLMIDEYYPSWQEPAWHTSLAWALVAWALLIAGFIVAIRKPRKNALPTR